MKDSTAQLTSLTQWSKERIQKIFESPSDKDSIRAIEETFSKNVDATINGRKITFGDIKQSVLSIRKDSRSGGLRVQWHQTVEAPINSSNEEGSFGGTYSIEGIQRVLPGDQVPTSFKRQKTVIVRIKAHCTETAMDSRRIVTLAFVAADLRIEQS
ncbi:hypothetical protein CPB84DRAFT_1672620 [Gymnopilus junonius]|uniref:Uncharacterized protein n=1 Tax=Gymnopilus junonius TaxID=109634 RepID=A0A9P5P0B5_GYMJU|nr:hypothetical protein CPB84DRAFT_1672620 [Gymnopilus junonius]